MSEREDIIVFDPVGDGGGIEMIIDQGRRAESMIKAINKMRHDEIYILTSICYDGQDYADLSKELKIPIGTLKSRVFRIRNKLRQNCNFNT